MNPFCCPNCHNIPKQLLSTDDNHYWKHKSIVLCECGKRLILTCDFLDWNLYRFRLEDSYEFRKRRKVL